MSPGARQKALLGCMGIVGLIFAFDFVTGGGKPKPAAAVAKAPTAAAAATLPVGETAESAAQAGADARKSVTELLAELEARAKSIAAEVIDIPQRDLFKPAAWLRSAMEPPPEPTAEQAAAEGGMAAREPSFAEKHKLQGTIMGRVAMAIIDGDVYRCGDELDGYVVLSIERDQVTLRRMAMQPDEVAAAGDQADPAAVQNVRVARPETVVLEVASPGRPR